jgi:hypothetical protein
LIVFTAPSLIDAKLGVVRNGYRLFQVVALGASGA